MYAPHWAIWSSAETMLRELMKLQECSQTNMRDALTVSYAESCTESLPYLCMLDGRRCICPSGHISTKCSLLNEGQEPLAQEEAVGITSICQGCPVVDPVSGSAKKRWVAPGSGSVEFPTCSIVLLCIHRAGVLSTAVP